MANNETWTVLSILNWSTEYLDNKGIDDARTVVEWLLCDTLSCSRMDLYLAFDRQMSEDELGKFRPMLLKCAAKQPVQQVLGSCEFYGIKLKVNEHVLVPRPETERLVEEAIKRAPELLAGIDPKEIVRKADDEHDEETVVLPKEVNILDIGSGSGCIAIALALHIPQAKIVAVEKSEEAVEVLKHNIKLHNLSNRIRVMHGDIQTLTFDTRFHMIVSNPPYIAQSEMAGLDKNVSYYEPHMALTDTDDGLGFYRYFTQLFPKVMSEHAVALLEFGGNHQSSKLTEIFSDYSREIIKDYQQDDRVIILQAKEA
jgi:release factor glutamine methyltransferase